MATLYQCFACRQEHLLFAAGFFFSVQLFCPFECSAYNVVRFPASAGKYGYTENLLPKQKQPEENI